MSDLNRIKVVLVEQKRTSKWLAEWCTNTSQPDLHTLKKIAEVLKVNIKDLLNSCNE